MPNWTPGYYQLMDFGKSVNSFIYYDMEGKRQSITAQHNNEWVVPIQKNKTIRVCFEVQTNKQFVANNYVDSNHAYLIPGAVFPYINGKSTMPSR